MARQSPKCCCCVPLRPGLLAWAYIKLVLALTSTGVCVYSLRYEIYNLVYRISRNHSPVVYVLEHLWPLGVCLLYLVFSIIFPIGLHRQSYKLLLVFLVYSIFEVILAGAGVGWQVYDLVRFVSYFNHYGDPEAYGRYLQDRMYDPVFYLPMIIPVVVNMLLPIYFSVLIKSEVQRLKRARVETRVIPVTKEQDKTYNLVCSNETPVRGKPLFPVEELERLRQQLGVKNV